MAMLDAKEAARLVPITSVCIGDQCTMRSLRRKVNPIE